MGVSQRTMTLVAILNMNILMISFIYHYLKLFIETQISMIVIKYVYVMILQRGGHGGQLCFAAGGQKSMGLLDPMNGSRFVLK